MLTIQWIADKLWNEAFGGRKVATEIYQQVQQEAAQEIFREIERMGHWTNEKGKFPFYPVYDSQLEALKAKWGGGKVMAEIQLDPNMLLDRLIGASPSQDN
jgi:hypothetical protein